MRNFKKFFLLYFGTILDNYFFRQISRKYEQFLPICLKTLGIPYNILFLAVKAKFSSILLRDICGKQIN